jgi:hypothetical protein
VAIKALDQPLGIVLVEDEPVGNDHVLEERASEHRCLKVSIRFDQIGDDIVGLFDLLDRLEREVADGRLAPARTN